jgi:hypothetical protein
MIMNDELESFVMEEAIVKILAANLPLCFCYNENKV